ncbi:MAG: SRPBCC domain-containing protein, partial [Myxococcales bacterium]|nr:SRPBCC domain-containing protein [Myxococcales bacterium]
MAEIRLRFTIAAPLGVVYEHLTTQEGIAGWWTREVVATPVVGSLMELRFNERGVVFRMRVDRLEPGREVAWTCEAGHPEWVGTRLLFRLSAVDGGTRLDF